jgi:hypothetical protein
MDGEDTAERPLGPGIPLRDGRTLRVDAQGVHVNDALYPLDAIQDARIVSPEPKTIGLRVAVGGLVTLVPERPEDADLALEQLYQLRPALRPAGYGNAMVPPYAPPLSYLPPPLYGAPPAYPPPTYPPPYGMAPPYGPPPVPPGYPAPDATFASMYGPPPAFPGYPVVPPTGGMPGSPVNEGGVGFWPQGIGEVIGTGFRLYFKRFGGLLVITLLTGIWPALLGGAVQIGLAYAEGLDPLQGSLTQQSPLTSSDPSSIQQLPIVQWFTNPTPMMIGELIGGAILWLVLMLLLSAWAVASMSLGARDAIAGRPVQIGAALGGGLRRMWSVLGVQLLEVGLVVIAYLAFVLPIFLFGFIAAFASVAVSGGDTTSSGGSDAAVVLGTICGFGLYLVLFVVAVIYITYRIYLATYAAAADSLSPFRALGRSWSLTWKNWWRTFLPLLVVSIAVSIVSSAGGMAQYFSIIAGALIATPLLSVIGQPLLAVMALTIYYDLRLRREGYPKLAMELGLPGLPPPPPPPGPAQPVHPAAG